MTTRELQNHLASDMLTKAFVYRQLEVEIYAILKNRKINLALLAECLGIHRNTAYYRLKHRLFTGDELVKIAEKAKEIYSLK
jgi:transcriptional regulator of acetoin/glycerol metabolism